MKHIAEAHHGRAWADNAEGGGAVVTISIPRRDATSATLATQRADARHTSQDAAEGSIDSTERADIVARHG